MANFPRKAVASPRLPAVLLALGWLLAAAGVWGAWVWASPAGLRVLGIDLAEYVKFMAEVRSGQIAMTREVFLLPLVAISLSMSLLAHRRDIGFPRFLAWVVNLVALPMALAMLPPAWTPALLRTPEFAKQTVAILVCLVCAVLSYPLLRRLPWLVSAAAVASLSVAGIALPIIAFARISGPLATIFGAPVSAGGAPLILAAGLLLITLAPLIPILRRRRSS